MLLVKNDPKYHEQWPRALVPYERIYGVDEPGASSRWPTTAASRRTCPPARHGLVGTSSLYKRESYPYGRPADGSVTASFAEETDRSGARGHDTSHNWSVQGADAGLYENDEIHAIRILLLEPTSETRPPGGRTYYNHARERMRILGEIPVRKFQRRPASARPRRQSRHQLSRQNSGRRGLDVSDAEQRRHGAEFFANMAPVAARRDAPRLRRLPRAQPAANIIRGDRRRQGRLQNLRPHREDAAADDQSSRMNRKRKWDAADEYGTAL